MPDQSPLTGTLILASRLPEPLAETLGAAGDWRARRHAVPDRPNHPVWQSRDLTPYLHPEPWFSPAAQPWANGIKTVESDEDVEAEIALSTPVLTGLRANPDAYWGLRGYLHREWRDLVAGTAPSKRADGRPFTDFDAVLMACGTIYDLRIMVDPEHAGDPPTFRRASPFARSVTRRASPVIERLRAAVGACLRAAGIQPDLLREVMTLGLLLHPEGICWIPGPLFLGPARDADNLQRPMIPALGIGASAGRDVIALLERFRRAFGFERPRKRGGPQPGSKNELPLKRVELEEYIRSRVVGHGVPVKELWRDAEFLRLYQAWKRDPIAEPALRTVQTLVKEARERAQPQG